MQKRPKEGFLHTARRGNEPKKALCKEFEGKKEPLPAPYKKKATKKAPYSILQAEI